MNNLGILKGQTGPAYWALGSVQFRPILVPFEGCWLLIGNLGCIISHMTVGHILFQHPWNYNRQVIHDEYANTYAFYRDSLKMMLRLARRTLSTSATHQRWWQSDAQPINSMGSSFVKSGRMMWHAQQSARAQKQSTRKGLSRGLYMDKPRTSWACRISPSWNLNQTS